VQKIVNKGIATNFYLPSFPPSSPLSSPLSSLPPFLVSPPSFLLFCLLDYFIVGTFSLFLYFS